MTNDIEELDLEAIAKQLDKTFNKPELLAAAEQFGTDVKKTISKPDLAQRLAEDGISVELIQNYNAEQEDYDPKELGLHPLQPGEVLEEEAVEEEEDEEEDLVLVRMTRVNRTYQIRGYTFKTDHPFALVKETDADYLIEVDGGFRMASPKEAREYYS